jgi:hypothetical protein
MPSESPLVALSTHRIDQAGGVRSGDLTSSAGPNGFHLDLPLRRAYAPLQIPENPNSRRGTFDIVGFRKGGLRSIAKKHGGFCHSDLSSVQSRLLPAGTAVMRSGNRI